MQPETLMTPSQYDDLRNRFRKVFEARWNASELPRFEEFREKFTFHMADVRDNLLALSQCYVEAKTVDAAALSERVEMFFIDCLPHLMAAAQIYDEIPMVFEEQRGVHDWDGFEEGDG